VIQIVRIFSAFVKIRTIRVPFCKFNNSLNIPQEPFKTTKDSYGMTKNIKQNTLIINYLLDILFRYNSLNFNILMLRICCTISLNRRTSTNQMSIARRIIHAPDARPKLMSRPQIRVRIRRFRPTIWIFPLI
jgi:hypothetical protein